MASAVFPGRFESLAEISNFFKKAAREAGLDEEGVYAVELAVDEACSNIIEHAYKGEDVGEIFCTCETKEEKLKITLKDTGTSFNPNNVARPNIEAPLMEREEGGLGMFLMQNLMDEVKYQTLPDGSNILIMVKRISS